VIQVFDPLLIAYITFTLLLAATPGATTAVVVRNTLAGGRGAGFAAAAGAALGNTSQATAAGLGVAVLISRFPAALVALRVLGAAYLAWLGVSSIWRVASRRESAFSVLAAGAAVSAEERRASFRQGLTVNLLNPAISTFYLVVVPSFLPTGAPAWHYAVLAALHIAIAFTCHGAWAMAFDRLREWFRVPAARRALEAATGVALLGLAARVLSHA
jgi:threonine/homoserine/homoserine lactone efflux protein